MTTTASAKLVSRTAALSAAARTALRVTGRASRSRWVWTPAAVGTASMATATFALARALTTPPPTSATRPAPWPLQMTPLGDGIVEIRGPAAGAQGRWGAEWPDGWGELGPVLSVASDHATRRLTALAGMAPTRTAPTRLNATIWTTREMFSASSGIAGHDLVVPGETGPLPAWAFPAGDGRRWALLVHGRGAPRSQMLRLVPALHAQGITAVIISYRNDQDECRDPSGRIHYGHREWLDLEAAVGVARQRGARSLILVGMSMGGAIIAAFLRRSSETDLVVGNILDAPALNWGPVLRHVARNRRVPGWLVPGVMATAALQTRIDWRALNHSGADHRPTIPVLLIHGDRDPIVPIEMSDAFAAMAPELVTYLRVEGAGHVSAYNTAAGSYDEAVTRFVSSLPQPRPGIPAV